MKNGSLTESDDTSEDLEEGSTGGDSTDTDSTSSEDEGGGGRSSPKKDGDSTDTDSTSTEYGYQTDTDSTSTDTDSISNETTASVFSQAGTYTLDVIVELFGQVTYLKELTETITVSEDGEVISHTVDYNGTTFNWSEIDAFVLTVTRDGNFTDEFAQEIADAYPTVAGISYSTAVLLVGTEIDDIILGIAGADGNITG